MSLLFWCSLKSLQLTELSFLHLNTPLEKNYEASRYWLFLKANLVYYYIELWLLDGVLVRTHFCLKSVFCKVSNILFGHAFFRSYLFCIRCTTDIGFVPLNRNVLVNCIKYFKKGRVYFRTTIDVYNCCNLTIAWI
jgi:hypothetical protein